jgi:hypothetical protein
LIELNIIIIKLNLIEAALRNSLLPPYSQALKRRMKI